MLNYGNSLLHAKSRNMKVLELIILSVRLAIPRFIVICGASVCLSLSFALETAW